MSTIRAIIWTLLAAVAFLAANVAYGGSDPFGSATFGLTLLALYRSYRNERAA